MKSILYIAALGLFLGACHPKAIQSLEKTTVTTSDSSHTEVTETPLDTSLHIKGDSSKITAQVTPDKNGQINLPETKVESEHSEASVSIKDGKLTAKCVCKDLELKVRLYEKQIREYASHKCAKVKESVKIITVTKEVRYIPWWVKILAWIGGIALIVIVIFLIVKPPLKLF